MARAWRVAIWILGMAVAWVLAACVLDRCGGEDDVRGEYDAIVVLGCRVRQDGTASVALAERVRVAARLWADGVAREVIVTGGVGEHGDAEAQVAAKLAVELGVPADAIVVEMRSTSTAENAAFAAGVSNARNLVVVTDAYHAWRAKRVFARWFASVRVVRTQSPELGPRVRGALREVLAIALYGIRGRL